MKSLVDLESKYCYADGGKVSLAAAALNAVKNAISHIENGDHASALATLRASPAAMAHPEVRAAASQLVSPSRAPVAAQQLRGVQNADTDARIMPTFAEGGSTTGAVPPAAPAAGGNPGDVSKLFHFMVQKMGVPPDMAARYAAAYHDPSSVVLPAPVSPQPPPQQMPQQGPPPGQGGPPPQGQPMGGQPGMPQGGMPQPGGQSANPQLIQQALQQQMGMNNGGPPPQ